MKDYIAKTGALVTCTDLRSQGLFAVMILTPDGDIHDRILTDDYQAALEHRRAFIKIAKACARKW